MGHFSGSGLGSRGRRSKASRLPRLVPGCSRRSEFPGGWAWEDSLGTGSGSVGVCVSPFVVGVGELALHASFLILWLCGFRQKAWALWAVVSCRITIESCLKERYRDRRLGRVQGLAYYVA